MLFELVRPQVCNEQVGPGAPVWTEAEPGNPPARASPHHAASDLSALHFILMGRGDDPSALGICEREAVRLNCHGPLALGCHGIVFHIGADDRVRGQ